MPDLKTPEQVVRAFFHRWDDGMDAMEQAFRDTMAGACVWGNTGFPDCHGPEESVGMLRQMREALPVAVVKGEIVKTVVQGRDVVVERIDHLLREDGSAILTMKVLGILAVQDGKIVEWREYADASALGALMTKGG